MNQRRKEQESLRIGAEAKLAYASTTMTKLRPPSAEKLLHELQVHQIELEMQNEELQRAQVELEKSRERYVDFYDFAPVGYLTLNHEGMIDEINLAGAALLGVERNKLPYHRFSSYIATEDRNRWQLHFTSVLACDDKLPCELAFQNNNEPRFIARLDCLRLSKQGKPTVVRVVLTDITESKRQEVELLESKNQLQATLDAIPDLLFEVGLDGRIYDYHSPRTDLLAAPPEAFLGKIFSDIFPSHVVDVLKQALTEAHEKGYSSGRQYELQLAQGKFWFELSVARKSVTHGQKPRFILLSHDMSRRKAAENELLEMHKLMDEVEQISKLGGWKYDCATRRITWSDEVYRIYGVGKDYDPNDVNRDIEFYSPEDKQTIAHAFMKAISDGEPYDLELRFTRLNGEHIWVRTIAKPTMENGKVAGVTGNIIDITERKQAEEQIYYLAFHDALTRIPNRRLMNDRLEQTMAASKRSGFYGALMFLDMDNFKPLNDVHGHEVGDSLLVEVARRISGCVREMDTVARFGGDEFMVMLSELDVDKAKSTAQANIVAEKIRAALSEPYALKVRHGDKAEITVEHHCTSSIGVVLFVGHEGSAEDIIKWADLAMYQAKEAGGNRVWFDYLKD